MSLNTPICFGAFEEIAQMIRTGQASSSGPTNLVIPRITTVDKHTGSIISQDPYSLLLDSRVIRLSGVFEDGMSDLITTLLLNLNAQSKQDISLYINSPGGSVISGLSIIDTMHDIGADVATIATGMAASMGAATLINGTPGKRMATPNAQIMVHQVSAGTQGTIKDMEIRFEHSKKLNEMLHAMFVEKTGQSEAVVDKWFDRDHWFSAEEALDNGIIDKVIKPSALKTAPTTTT